MLITTEGIVIRMKSDSISVIGRNTSGVKLINIDADSDIKVASVAKVRFQEEDEVWKCLLELRYAVHVMSLAE